MNPSSSHARSGGGRALVTRQLLGAAAVDHGFGRRSSASLAAMMASLNLSGGFLVVVGTNVWVSLSVRVPAAHLFFALYAHKPQSRPAPPFRAVARATVGVVVARGSKSSSSAAAAALEEPVVRRPRRQVAPVRRCPSARDGSHWRRRRRRLISFELPPRP